MRAQLLLRNAISLAAWVSAKHALPLYAEYRRIDPFGGAVVGLVNVMAEHGHIGDAIEYLSDPLPGDRFPLSFVNDLEGECPSVLSVRFFLPAPPRQCTRDGDR